MELKDWAALAAAFAAAIAAIPAIPKSSARPKWIVACSVLLLLSLTFAFAGRKSGDTTSPTGTGPTGAPVAPAPSEAEETTSAPPPAETSVTPPGELLIQFSVDETYSLGKDKAQACPEPEAHFCIILNRTVSDDSGQVESGCTLSWRLYPDKSSKLKEKGRITSCNSSADSIFIGDGIPIEAGAYRLEASVELDDGTTGSGTYRFTAID